MKRKSGIKILLFTIIIILIFAVAFTAIAAIPAEFDSNDIRDRFPLHQNNENVYNRENVRKYVEYASDYLQNGTFRFLSPANGDSATDCANYVSQCLYAGGFEMTDLWYMKRYSDSVLKIKRITDKICTSLNRFNYVSYGIGNGADYTDMNYVWTYTWSCAGEQIDYFEKNFAEGRYEANNYEQFSELVKSKNINTGDVIYQCIDNIHHVVIVSDVSENGIVYISSHNPPLFDFEINEDSWQKSGFSGGAVILKIKDYCS
ncbi:MAG: amidase domain-containing protein [Oscillospiraceae bacterium]|nr:amidase domain-containing protein [Oscillospiraceae bacterium]